MKISRSALLPYSARQMYDVVSDISAYPEFLNWCDSAKVISDEANEVVAKLFISYKSLNIKFTTRNINTVGESIKLNLVEGPFTSLDGQWSFQALRDDACKVTIDMKFNFDLTITNHIMGQVFTKIVSTQLDAFHLRASNLYQNA